MHFDNTLLSTADQAALTTAIAAIPALLTPLSAAITSAQTANAGVASLRSQIDTAKAAASGGTLPQSFYGLVNQLHVAEASVGSNAVALHTACQACEPLVVQQLLPIAVRQAVSQVQTANAGLVPSGSNEANAGPLGSTFVIGMSAYFRSCFGPHESTLTDVLAKATKLQTLLTAIENGNDFFSIA